MTDVCGWMDIKTEAMESSVPKEVPEVSPGQAYIMTVHLDITKCTNAATQCYRIGESSRIGWRCDEHPAEFESWHEIPIEEAIVIEVMGS